MNAPVAPGDPLEAADDAALAGGDDVEAALMIDAAWRAACERLDDPQAWLLVKRVAGALLAGDGLDGDEFARAVARRAGGAASGQPGGARRRC